MYKMAFDDRMDFEYYCYNCIYNHIEIGQVPNFKAYNITAKLGMMYMYTIEYSDLLFFSECQRLLIKNSIRGSQTTANQIRVCEKALNNFMLRIWPVNGLASLNFLIA